MFEKENKPKKKYYSYVIGVFLLLTFSSLFLIFGFVFGNIYMEKKFLPQNKEGVVTNKEEIPEFLSKDVDFKEFWQIWKYVKENYVKEDVSDTKLFYGAIGGMVASLNDPYTVFFNPEISKKFNDELSGSFEGIGAEIGIKDDQLTIIAPLQESPAQKAGLKAGDKVLAIDGLDTANIALDYAVSLIRGEKGTEVKLTVLSKSAKEPREILIIRDMIKIESVKFSTKDEAGKDIPAGDGFTLKEGNIAYIQLSFFNEDTLGDWNKMMQKLMMANPKGVILDLRNNPGGFLTTAIEVAGEWIDGQTVVYERARDGQKTGHKATRAARLNRFPTVVLVNGGSASGSEIVAGALQDYGMATLIGETTFGKGSVQDLRDFPDGSSVKLTIAEWLTPKEKNINKEGIKPDIEIKITKEDIDADKDPQLDKAIEILKEKSNQ